MKRATAHVETDESLQSTEIEQRQHVTLSCTLFQRIKRARIYRIYSGFTENPKSGSSAEIKKVDIGLANII